MKRLLSLVIVGAAVAASYAMLGALNPVVPAQTWLAASDMTDVRAGAAGTLLPDGRVIVTGGVTESGVTASAERYSPTAWGFVATPSMQDARANHTATLLADGRVLVAGGTGVDGQVVTTAEIFDASANAWMPAGSLNVPRRGHTATRLADGRVLIAGGDMGGQPTAAVEIFDPSTSMFTPLDETLAVPRVFHAAALLGDGRVLIAGGFDGQEALASSDLYDPAAGTLSAGPVLSAARAGLSATTLLDRRVLLVGGSSADGDLATADVFDPTSNTIASTDDGLSIARRGHLAFLLPHNNQVLIVGGTAAGTAVAAAELYTPWEGTHGRFCATGGVNGSGICASGYVAPGQPAAAREWAIGAALSYPADQAWRSGPNDGALLLTGGSGHRTAELYGFATIHTDKDDYTPGSTVTIFGSGWQPGETVALVLQEEPLLDRHPLVSVTADADGNILSTEFSPDEHDLDVRFYLTAYGEASQAQTTFTDGKPNAVTVSTQVPVPVVAGGTATYSLNVAFNGTFNTSNPSCTASLSLTPAFAGRHELFIQPFVGHQHGAGRSGNTDHHDGCQCHAGWHHVFYRDGDQRGRVPVRFRERDRQPVGFRPADRNRDHVPPAELLGDRPANHRRCLGECARGDGCACRQCRHHQHSGRQLHRGSFGGWREHHGNRKLFADPDPGGLGNADRELRWHQLLSGELGERGAHGHSRRDDDDDYESRGTERGNGRRTVVRRQLLRGRLGPWKRSAKRERHRE